MSEPGKGTHWSNLISLLGVGGKKTSEPTPEAAPVAEEAPTAESPAATNSGTGPELQIDWGKPATKKRSTETKSSARGRTKPVVGEKPASAARPPAVQKRKHWGSLAEQLGLPTPDPELVDEPEWIEESEQSGATLSGDDAADECVSHPGGQACAPEQCEGRTEACKMRAVQEEVLDTRDTEFLDDGPATDDDLEALAEMINEGMPPAPAARSTRRADDEDEEEEGVEGRSSREEGGEPRRRRRRRGRGRREEGAAEGRREPVSRTADDDGDRYDRYDDRDEELDLELGRDDDLHEREDDLEDAPEGRRSEESDGERTGRRRRRRRRRRSSEGAADADRSSPRDLEPQDRVRSGDLEYRRGKADDVFDDEGDGDDSVGAHRNLPTWEDALSTIIGANMDARARSPQQHSGRRGGGRGDRDRGRDYDRSDRGGDRGGRGDRGGDRYSDRGSDRGSRRDDRR